MFWLDVLENLKISLAMLLETARWHTSSEMETTVLWHNFGKVFTEAEFWCSQKEVQCLNPISIRKGWSLKIAFKVLYFSSINSVVNHVPRPTEKHWKKCHLDLGSNLLFFFFFLLKFPLTYYLHNFITIVYHAEKLHVRVEEIWLCNCSLVLGGSQELPCSYMSHTHCTVDHFSENQAVCSHASRQVCTISQMFTLFLLSQGSIKVSGFPQQFL